MSVVLPAYNEADTLRTTVETTLETLAGFLPDGAFELIIAEDGCDDRTPRIADRLATTEGRVRHVHSDDRLGRGGALVRAFREADGEVLVYFDTDLATDMRHLQELVESVRSGEYDIATGSRWLRGHEADRPVKRSVASRGYNMLVRTFLGSEVRDHQCGFKAFDRAALFDVLDDVADDHWFWDTEVLVRAQRRGYRVKEFPVNWTPTGETTVDLVQDTADMGAGILRTWWEFSVDPRLTPRTSALAGFALVVVAIAALAQFLEPSVVLAEIRGSDPGLLVAAIAVYTASWPARGFRYRWILEGLGYRGDAGFLTGAIFISQTGNLVFPARAGDAIRAYVVKARRGVGYATGAASLAVERIYDLLTITGFAVVVLTGIAGTAGGLAPLGEVAGQGRPWLLAAAAVAAATIGLTAAIALTARSAGSTRFRSRAPAAGGVVESIVGIAQRFVVDVRRATADRERSLHVSASSIVIWALDVLTAAVVLAALGVDVRSITIVGAVTLAVSVGNLAKVLPIAPGGIGLYEGAFTTVIVALTPIAWEVALGAAILDHAVKNAVTVGGGLASAAVLNVSLTTAVEQGRDVEPLASD